MKEKFVIAGAGDHGKVVKEIMELSCPRLELEGFIDIYNNPEFKDVTIQGKKVLCMINDVEILREKEISKVVIACGDNYIRERTYYSLKEKGFTILAAIHPSAIISEYAVIEEGANICAGVIIGPGAVIGKCVVLNTSSSIDHDVRIEDFCFIAPGVKIAGNVKIGKKSFIGIGASIIDEISIGENVVVGAGSVVIDDIDDNQKVVGVPAKSIKR